MYKSATYVYDYVWLCYESGDERSKAEEKKRERKIKKVELIS